MVFGVLVFLVGMVAGVASARLLSSQTIFNNVFDSSDDTLKLTGGL